MYHAAVIPWNFLLACTGEQTQGSKTLFTLKKLIASLKEPKSEHDMSPSKLMPCPLRTLDNAWVKKFPVNGSILKQSHRQIFCWGFALFLSSMIGNRVEMIN